MNLRNLEYFLVAAEELNFTRAADRLFITQQSLSHHIQKLESEFGTPLFERTPPMTLTPAGACFLRADHWDNQGQGRCLSSYAASEIC